MSGLATSPSCRLSVKKTLLQKKSFTCPPKLEALTPVKRDVHPPRTHACVVILVAMSFIEVFQ